MSEFLAGPAGAYVAIFAMTVATYLCRASGVVLMSRIRITPRIERGLRALPGSIVISTILPLGVHAGPGAVGGLGVAIAIMAVSRNELAALIGGLGAVTLLRAAGL